MQTPNYILEQEINKLKDQLKVMAKRLDKQDRKIEEQAKKIYQLEQRQTHVPSPLYGPIDGPPYFTDDIPF